MRKRAMTPEQASLKKISGHVNEYDFAELIGGAVNLGSPTDKKDVIDQQHRSHSVKGGTWWQIFLYAKSRLLTNTIFRGLGNIAEFMIQCIDAFPEDRSDYLADKQVAKIRLQEPMRLLKQEIEKPDLFPALLEKSLFNGGEVNYLSILPHNLPNVLPIGEKHFHVFSQRDVVNLLSTHLEIRNSKARNRRQMDDQKVIFRFNNRNLGEIEIRTDSDTHYKLIKWRVNSPAVFGILTSNLKSVTLVNQQISVYGSARNTFSINV